MGSKVMRCAGMEFGSFCLAPGLVQTLKQCSARGQEHSGLGGGKNFYVALSTAKSSAGAALVGTSKEKLSGEPGQGWAAWCHLPMPFTLTPFLLAQQNLILHLSQVRKQHRGLATWYHDKAGESKQQQGAYHELIFAFGAHCCQMGFSHRPCGLCHGDVAAWKIRE